VNPQDQECAERRLLLALLGNQKEVTGRAAFLSLLEQVNWRTFLAITSRDLYPYVAFRLEPYIDNIAPFPEWAALFNARRLTAVHNLRLRHELGKAIEALQQSGIPALALKGLVLAYAAYGDPSLRPMSDLDLLVPTGMRDRALNTLHKLGFGYPDGFEAIHQDHNPRLTPEHEFAPPLRLSGTAVLLEVHSQLECAEPLSPIPVQEFWSRSVPVDLMGLTVMTLCPEDFLLHLCLHASRRHRFETGLRSLVDIRAHLDAHSNLDWATIAARSICGGCAPWMYLTLQAARDLAGAPIPDLFFKTLPPVQGVVNLRHLADEQLFSARSGKPRLPLIPTLLAEGSWRNRTRMFFKRMRLVRREELGSSPRLVRLIQLAWLSSRRLFITLKIMMPRLRRAWEDGQWKVGAISSSVRSTRNANTLFRLVEQAGRTNNKH
jgi:hypothetical protein